MGARSTYGHYHHLQSSSGIYDWRRSGLGIRCLGAKSNYVVSFCYVLLGSNYGYPWRLAFFFLCSTFSFVVLAVWEKTEEPRWKWYNTGYFH